jgi:hypothetical protein
MRFAAWSDHEPEWPPDMECPVEPNPPRAAEGADEVELVPVPLRLEVSAVETEVGPRPMDEKLWRFEDEYEFQPQLPHERVERRRHGCSCAAFCGSAACGLSVVDAAGCARHSGRGGIT